MRQDIPNSPNRGSSSFQQIVGAFMSQDGLPFSGVLTNERIEQVFARHGGLLGQHGVYSTPIVLRAFLSQVLQILGTHNLIRVIFRFGTSLLRFQHRPTIPSSRARNRRQHRITPLRWP